MTTFPPVVGSEAGPKGKPFISTINDFGLLEKAAQREQKLPRALGLCPAPCSDLEHPGNGATMANTDKPFYQHSFHVKLNNRANKKEQDRGSKCHFIFFSIKSKFYTSFPS